MTNSVIVIMVMVMNASRLKCMKKLPQSPTKNDQLITVETIVNDLKVRLYALVF